MARRPATLELAGGKTPRQQIWEVIRAFYIAGEEWTQEMVSRKLPKIEETAIRDYRRCLVAAGIVECTVKAGTKTPAKYRIVKDCGLEAPRLRKDGTPVVQGLAQEQMWRTLRMMSGDTNHRELAAHASTTQVQVDESAAKDYLLTLNRAGYLVCTAKGTGVRGRGGIQSRFRLKPNRNTGPRPPMVCRLNVIYDPNEGRVVWQPEEVTEEDAVHGK